MAEFPNQNIPEYQKNKDWVAKHFDYAKFLLGASNARNERFTRAYNTYNGNVNPLSVAYLTSTYGKRNKTKYISYKIARPKIDLIKNEFLERPLQSTVYTINESARTKKLDDYELLLGAAHTKDTIKKLNELGVDPLEGMEIPEPNEEDIWNLLSTKEKHQDIMQLIIDEQIPALLIKQKLADCMFDVETTSMCYSKIDVDERGNENFMRIDPRKAIFEEIENDTFIERSPVMGHMEVMPIHNILMRFNLNQEQANKLEQIRKDPSSFIGNENYAGAYTNEDGRICANVYFIEWKSIEASYYKKSPKTKSQLDFDSTSDSFLLELDRNAFEESKEVHDKNVAAGKYEIITTYKEVLWEAVMIGHDMVVYGRKKPYMLKSVDKPADLIGFSYTGFLFNTVNGQRVSLMEIIENFSNIFDIVMFQILKEINKAKGKLIAYNRKFLPKGTSLKRIMYNMVNDSFVDYDTNGATNLSGKDGDITDMFKELDLGLSSSFPALIELKREILATVDRLTGINENREGQIKASSTASNAQESIAASRTMTEGLFYGMSLYTEKVLLKLVTTTKLTWGLTKSEKGRIILGDSKFKFMEVTKDIAYNDYGIHISDSSKEIRIKSKLDRYVETALNSKDLKFKDLVKYEMSETLTDAIKVLQKANDEIEKIRQQDLANERQANAEMQKQAMDTNIQIAREDREDKQLNEKDNIVLKGDTEIRVKNSVNAESEKNKMISKQNEIEQNALLGKKGNV